MDDWDAEDYTPPVFDEKPKAEPAPAKTPVKDNWDDDSDEDSGASTGDKKGRNDDDDLFNEKPKEKIDLKKKAPKAAPKAAPKVIKAVPKAAPKAAAPKAAAPKAAAPKAAPKPAPKEEVFGDALSEKQYKQALIERADLKHAKDLFDLGDDEEEEEIKIPPPRAAGNSRDLIDSFAGRTEAEFETFATEVATKLLRHEDSPHFIKFLRAMVKHIGQSKKLTAEDFKNLGITVNIVEKEKRAQESKKGKKKKPTQKKANLEEVLDDYVEGEFSTYERAAYDRS